MCISSCSNNQQPGLFGSSLIDAEVADAAEGVQAAFKAVGDLDEDSTQLEITQAQTQLQGAKQRSDLLQEMKKMMNQIYESIIRNINIR